MNDNNYALCIIDNILQVTVCSYSVHKYRAYLHYINTDNKRNLPNK